jgi:hypothetical protein
MGATALVACASQAPGGSGHESVPATALATQQKTPQNDKDAIPSGYRREMINGQERFCRRDAITGSRAQIVEV